MTLKEPIEPDLIARIANIREQLHSGRFGQREIWEQILVETETVLAAQAHEISAMRQTIIGTADGSLVCDQAEEIAVQTQKIAELKDECFGLRATRSQREIEFGMELSEETKRAEAAEARVRELTQEIERLKQVSEQIIVRAEDIWKGRAEAAEARVRELEGRLPRQKGGPVC